MSALGARLAELRLDNPIRAIRDISLDRTGRTPVKLADGRRMSALEIQGEYLARALEYADREGVEGRRQRAGEADDPVD